MTREVTDMEHVTALVDHDATTPSTNVFATKARNAKAAKIADVLIAHGATAAEARALPIESRLTASTLAGARRPSPVTWDLVCELLACVERSRSLTPLAERLDDDLEEQLFARL
jgi:hypothetical protein